MADFIRKYYTNSSNDQAAINRAAAAKEISSEDLQVFLPLLNAASKMMRYGKGYPYGGGLEIKPGSEQALKALLDDAAAMPEVAALAEKAQRAGCAADTDTYGQLAMSLWFVHGDDSGNIYAAIRLIGALPAHYAGMEIVNATPHAVALNDGTVFPPSGNVIRIQSTLTNTDKPGFFSRVYMPQVSNLPKAIDGRYFIVSAIVKNACPDRADFVSPATDHPQARRNDKGHIVSVPGFVI